MQHAPEHLREAFIDWVVEGRCSTRVVVDDRERPLDWLIGRLWNCTDYMPRHEADEVQLEDTRTYAAAVRDVKRGLDRGIYPMRSALPSREDGE